MSSLKVVKPQASSFKLFGPMMPHITPEDLYITLILGLGHCIVSEVVATDGPRWCSA